MTSLKYVFLLLSVLTFYLCGCTDRNPREVDLGGISVNMPVERLEGSLFACRSVTEVLEFLNQNPSLARFYFNEFSADPGQIAERLYQNISNPALAGFKHQIDSVFTDFNQSVSKPLEDAFRHLQYYYPTAQIPRVQTLVTGFLGKDLFISDSLIIIGLDYFGGPRARFRPDVYHYQLPRYQKEYIVPSILFFYAQQYNRLAAEDRTLLADMVWYGKNFEFVRYMMPKTPDSLVLGFSGRDLAKAEVSQKDIWAHLTTNRLLYESIEQKKEKYVGERPLTYEIGEDVPGGIGRWVGWKIVSTLFNNHPEKTLQQVMAADNARIILEESGYKGQRE